MSLDKDWDSIRPDRSFRAGMGVLRIALLFGSTAIAVALMAIPYLEGKKDQFIARNPAGLDMMATGSIRSDNTYTVRRSVLQPSPGSVCIIRDNGSRSGEC
ncbi:hypothetical protein [Mesorhizobium sp. BE184]|uniref:hypothetical protein n=1 Tax=Mesorhizobium sp. BE184 TaxID=2817714 RepID=UPI00285728F8|nr:hypothetical protein [Mesorhizobium sp. BE184]MDR7034350.1 hypothetical protein [Mesorhizobium sp. BE184]